MPKPIGPSHTTVLPPQEKRRERNDRPVTFSLLDRSLNHGVPTCALSTWSWVLATRDTPPKEKP